MGDELFSRQSETILLSGLLRNPSEYWTINDIGIVPSDFGSREGRIIFNAIQSVAADKESPEVAPVLEELRRSGHGASEEYLSRLLNQPCSLAQANDAARTVKGLAISRGLQQVGVKTIEIAREKREDYEGAIAEIEGEFASIRRGMPKSSESAVIGDIIESIKSRGPQETTSIRFSPTLQYFTGGLAPGHLWVIGGFSSVGKSAVAVNLISDVLQARDKWVGVVSTEMPKESYAIRLLSCLSGVPQRNIRERVMLSADAVTRINKAEGFLEGSLLRVYDNLYTIKQIRGSAIRQQKMEGLDVLVVDFLQNINITGDEVSDARTSIIELQQLAKELRITVVAFSQISNSQAQWAVDPNADQNFYSFKGHGAIRDAADVAIMLKRDQQGQSPILNLTVVKNRHEQLGKIICKMDLVTGRITEVNSEA